MTLQKIFTTKTFIKNNSTLLFAESMNITILTGIQNHENIHMSFSLVIL